MALPWSLGFLHLGLALLVLLTSFLAACVFLFSRHVPLASCSKLIAPALLFVFVAVCAYPPALLCLCALLLFAVRVAHVPICTKSAEPYLLTRSVAGLGFRAFEKQKHLRNSG